MRANRLSKPELVVLSCEIISDRLQLLSEYCCVLSASCTLFHACS